MATAASKQHTKLSIVYLPVFAFVIHLVWCGRGFWLATIVAFSIFMLGAAIGHMRSMIRDHNFAPGNAGFFFWYDVIVPVALVVLYALT